MLRHKLSGVGAAMITPFTADGRVDYKALARMIDYVIDGGVDYIVALGTTAETPTLYMPERAVIAMFITTANRSLNHKQTKPPARKPEVFVCFMQFTKCSYQYHSFLADVLYCISTGLRSRNRNSGT